MVHLSNELSEKINQSESRQKELKFFQLRNDELCKKMEKFEFLIKEKESFLLMYKNSQNKVNKLESERNEMKEEMKKLKNKFVLAVNCIFETNDQKLISQLDDILAGQK